jgi:hypothetical protein
MMLLSKRYSSFANIQYSTRPSPSIPIVVVLQDVTHCRQFLLWTIDALSYLAFSRHLPWGLDLVCGDDESGLTSLAAHFLQLLGRYGAPFPSHSGHKIHFDGTLFCPSVRRTGRVRYNEDLDLLNTKNARQFALLQLYLDLRFTAMPNRGRIMDVFANYNTK